MSYGGIYGDLPLGDEGPVRNVVESGFDGALDVAGAMATVDIAVALADAIVLPDFAGVGGAIAFTSATGSISVDIETVSGMSEVPPLRVAEDVEMMPLVISHEADELEMELKAVFLGIFERLLRPDERFMNVLGMPHHGDGQMVENSLTTDGLSIYRGAAVAGGSGSYLLRSWRAHNPKRGLHLLKTYLQLLWPNVWTCDQMWQDKDEPYPEALEVEDGGNHFLTSRVHVTLPARTTDGGDANAIRSGLRAALPARMMLNMALTDQTTFQVGLAAVVYRGAVAQKFVGSFK